MSRRALALLVAVVVLGVFPTAANAAFGIEPGSLSFSFENRDGTRATQAGSHPYAFNLGFKLNTEPGGETEGGAMRDALTDLPPGLLGNLQAVPACTRQDYEGPLPQCPPSTQVGVVRAILPEFNQEAEGPLYNLVPPPGSAAMIGFGIVEFNAFLLAEVRSEEGYAIRVASPNIPKEASEIRATIWGTPADPSHDPERGPEGNLSTDAPLLPFLTLPTSCGAPPSLSVQVDSKLDPGNFLGESVPLRDQGTPPQPQVLTGCEAVPFSPKILAAPTTTAAESPAGLGFQLKLPNQGLLNPAEGAVTETEPTKTVVTLPPGITANPAAVNGQGVCTPAQFKSASASFAGCPQSSKLGSLVVHTPLLEEAVEGSLYLAAPHDNPFDSLLALYIVATAPQRGVLAKQAGQIEVDRDTGQLTTTIEGLPPVPYSDFEVRLREGARAPLITPQICGTYNTTVKLYSFADPATAVERTAPFTLNTGANGGACALGEAALPNHPTLSAGSTVPIAGAFSPFLFKLSRNDGEQRFGALEATLPQGLSAKLAGVPYCPEAAIAAATARSREGEGALELAAPSCPAASQVGTVLAGAGAGPSPYYVGGSAYLAGPYKGAPLSIAFITPAIAGPFDLGVLVIRAALYVDPETAKVTVKSDPLPRILHGFPLDLRSVAVRMERESFTLNPTSCEDKQITAKVTSIAGVPASVQNRFRVGSCKGLEFSPKLSLAFSGGTKRSQHPALKVVLTQPKDQANIARASFTLPSTQFIDPNHISNPCTRVQFSAGKCPPSSVLGKVKVITPLLEKPLQGPIYFRSNGGERDLPDAVADLHGQVDLVSVGFVDAVHKKGSEQSRIRTTIATVPDAPLTKVVIELNSGKKKGLLVNSQNLCTTKVSQRAIVKLAGQNGKTHDSNPLIANNCGK